MIKSMFSAVTGLRSHQTMMDVIGNNIANVNTVGFKASRVVFTDVYYQTLASANKPDGVNAGGTNPMQTGYGASVSSIDVLNSRSGFMQTDRPNDLYISGDGYFVVKDAGDEISYTRAGNFTFDAGGSLVDANGNHVCGANGSDPLDLTATGLAKINIANFEDYSNISIGKNGAITGLTATGVTTALGQIALANFANPDGLIQNGTLYNQPSANSGDPIVGKPGDNATGSLIGGGLEMSNVDLSKQFTDMIIAQRGFQANSRVITTSDEILQELVNLKR